MKCSFTNVSSESKTKKICQFDAKNDTAPKLGGMIHYTIKNKLRTGALKNLQWTLDFLHYICKVIKNPKT